MCQERDTGQTGTLINIQFNLCHVNALFHLLTVITDMASMTYTLSRFMFVELMLSFFNNKVLLNLIDVSVDYIRR